MRSCFWWARISDSGSMWIQKLWRDRTWREKEAWTWLVLELAESSGFLVSAHDLRFLNESECSLVFAIPSFSPGLHYMINDLLGGHWQKSPHTSQAINNNDYWFFYAPRHKTKWGKVTCGLSGLASGSASGVGRHIISVGSKLGWRCWRWTGWQRVSRRAPGPTRWQWPYAGDPCGQVD